MPNKICGAKTKGGSPCKTSPMENGRCRLHGGATPRGLANPNTKHGRWSKDLPTRLAAKYQQAKSDEQLLELRDELAVVDVRLSDLLSGVDAGGASETWRELSRMVAAYKSAGEDERPAMLDSIFATVKRGARDWQRWEDVFKAIERRTRLAESERKRLVEMQQMMTSDQAMTLLAAVVDTVRKHVTDPNALRGISADITRLVADGVRYTH